MVCAVLVFTVVSFDILSADEAGFAMEVVLSPTATRSEVHAGSCMYYFHVHFFKPGATLDSPGRTLRIDSLNFLGGRGQRQRNSDISGS